MTANPFTVEQTLPNVHVVRFDKVAAGWEQWLLLTGDRHHDNIHSDWEFEKLHLEQVRERNALIIDVGDLFCAMQGKYDPRSSMEALRPEHKTDRYLDALVDTAADFYRPYANSFLVIGRGNHETNITKRHGTDLTDALCRELRRAPNIQVQAGGYGGWVRLEFNIQKTVRTSIKIKYFHGGGGGAIMTSGTLDNRRQASFLPDADILVNGHTHDQYVLPLQRERLSDRNKIYQDALWCVRTGTYKDEYGQGAGGWHVEKRGTPKPIGAVWIKLALEIRPRTRIRIEPTLSLRDA